jgi:hypothetical protein
MLSRLTLLFVSFFFLVAVACGGTKGGSGSSSYRSGGGGGGDDDDGYSEPVPKANELKEASDDAVRLTEDNHKMAREIFELKNKLGLPTDE